MIEILIPLVVFGMAILFVLLYLMNHRNDPPNDKDEE